MLKRGKDIKKISAVVRMLANGETLPPQFCNHALVGDLVGLRDCHVENDWVLIYALKTEVLILTFADSGMRSDVL